MQTETTTKTRTEPKRKAPSPHKSEMDSYHEEEDNGSEVPSASGISTTCKLLVIDMFIGGMKTKAEGDESGITVCVAKKKKKNAASKKAVVKKLSFNWKVFPTDQSFPKGTEVKAIFGGSMHARIPREFGLILFPKFTQQILRATVSRQDNVKAVEDKVSELAGRRVILINKGSKLNLDNEMGMDEMFLIKECLSVEEVEDVPLLVRVKDEK